MPSQVILIIKRRCEANVISVGALLTATSTSLVPVRMGLLRDTMAVTIFFNEWFGFIYARGIVVFRDANEAFDRAVLSFKFQSVALYWRRR